MSKMNIKVMGGGCSKCETLLHNTKEAVKAAGIDADVEYIGHVFEYHFLVSEKRCRDYRERRILVSAHGKFAGKLPATFDSETCHMVPCLLSKVK